LTHARVGQLAEQVGLAASLLARKPASLSGGEQQRVAIARTLAAEPRVILYDEPLANLDPERRRALRALIRALAAEHATTLVYVTHDPEEALEIGDELAVLADGRVVEQGLPQALYRAPRTLGGARALGPVTVLPGICSGGALRTALGTLKPVDPSACLEGATCSALLRPESILTCAVGGVEVRVDDVIARGVNWGFTGVIDGLTLRGRSGEPVRPGDLVHVAVEGAVAIVAAAQCPQEAP